MTIINIRVMGCNSIPRKRYWAPVGIMAWVTARFQEVTISLSLAAEIQPCVPSANRVPCDRFLLCRIAGPRHGLTSEGWQGVRKRADPPRTKNVSFFPWNYWLDETSSKDGSVSFQSRIHRPEWHLTASKKAYGGLISEIQECLCRNLPGAYKQRSNQMLREH